MANTSTLPDTSDSDSSSGSSHNSSESNQSDDGPPGLLHAGQVGADSGEETGAASDYNSKSGGSDDDYVKPPPLMEAQPEDPETIRKAGNSLFNNGNIEEAIEKHKEAKAGGSKGGVQMSTKNCQQIPPPPSKDDDEIEVLEEEAEQHTSKKGQPYLPPRSQDDDFPAIRRKEPRQKKAVDKWNLLWFVPMPILNRQYGGA